MLSLSRNFIENNDGKNEHASNRTAQCEGHKKTKLKTKEK